MVSHLRTGIRIDSAGHLKTDRTISPGSVWSVWRHWTTAPCAKRASNALPTRSPRTCRSSGCAANCIGFCPSRSDDLRERCALRSASACARYQRTICLVRDCGHIHTLAERLSFVSFSMQVCQFDEQSRPAVTRTRSSCCLSSSPTRCFRIMYSAARPGPGYTTEWRECGD
jgi:hypothetical protein